MKRAVILVLDSFGIGAADDAERFGDVGADTLGHIAAHCAQAAAAGTARTTADAAQPHADGAHACGP